MEPAQIDTAASSQFATLAEEISPARRGRTRPCTLSGLVPFGYLSPTVLLILVLMVIPIVMVVSYSFKDNVIVEQNPVFAGLANYTKVLTDPNFLVALKNTFIFITLSTIAHLVLGLAFATLLNTPLLSGVTKAIFRIVYILPWFFMISILAGLQGISSDLYEAAAVDGAGAFQRFRHVTIPQLRPVLISMAVLDLIWTSQQFALIWLTTGGGPLNVTEMLSTFTYKQAFSNYEFATASAAAVIVLLITMILAFFYVRQQRER